MYEIKSRRLGLQILACFIFLVLFKIKITVLLKKATFRKYFIVEEELDCINIDDTGNLKDSPRFVFTDEECNLIAVNDGAALTRNINQRKKSDVLQ